MPAFPESKLSRKDAADIYSYLKSSVPMTTL
jgi:mono/diheme cytochrome c family protein